MHRALTLERCSSPFFVFFSPTFLTQVEEWFERSREEDNMLGLYSQEQLKEEYEQDGDVETVEPLTEERLKEEVLFRFQRILY